MNPFAHKKAIQNHLVDLTKQLISFPSHADEPNKIFDLVEFIKAYFEKEKVIIREHLFGGIPSLVITTDESKCPTILLSGHIDVVPSSNRYTAEEENGWLFGSGAMDMKGGIAVMMAILKYFSRGKKQPSLALMITSDEEVGSSNGTKALLAHEFYRPHFVIINEGRHSYDIVTREKGILIVKLVTTGEYIHSAYPWKGKNAVIELAQCLLEIQKVFPAPKDAWLPTASVTVFHGGEETNTIPGRAEATVNIRLTGGICWSREAVLKKIEKQLPAHIKIEKSHYGGIFIADMKNPFMRLLKEAVQKVLKKKVRFHENHGASDAKVFMKYGLPVAILGPVGKEHHSPQEAVEIQSLVTHFEVLRRFITQAEVESHLRRQSLITG